MTSGQVEVGIWSDGNANNWATFDNFELTKQYWHDINMAWTTIASNEGSGAVVTANFPITEARYIKVTLKEASSSWWSIAEFNVYE